ncbi:tetraspanin-16 isoform X3 [Hyla sarda]|uniref:tetraspanin-16 isoform X3 n=1 Tax=Hyla sarda TaxID=327740 RepID=UPI0024C3B1E9|nr:tetraspanin-16 isoform X3 [Hyla sarda]
MEESPTGSPRLYSSYTFLRYVMVFINTMICFFGLVLVGLGLWTRYSTDSMVNTLGSQSVHFRNLSLFCIAAGTVMCILGFLGCFGALKKNRSLLLIAESIVKDKGLQFLKESYYESNDKGLVDEGLDSVMQKFNCCGFFGYEDFVNSTFSMKTGLKYPKPCCKDPELSVCNGLTTSDQVIYTKGCFLAILEQVKKNSMALGIAAAVITGWELSSIIIALMLFVKLG